jgi:hypothetical protein
MEYVVKCKVKKALPVKEYADIVIRRLLDDLERFEVMPDEDLLEVEGVFSEVIERMDSLKEQIEQAKERVAEENARVAAIDAKYGTYEQQASSYWRD